MTGLSPGDGDDDPERQKFVNIAVLVVVIVLVVLGYWAFNALEHSRKFQRCLDSGRRNCVDFASPEK